MHSLFPLVDFLADHHLLVTDWSGTVLLMDDTEALLKHRSTSVNDLAQQIMDIWVPALVIIYQTTRPEPVFCQFVRTRIEEFVSTLFVPRGCIRTMMSGWLNDLAYADDYQVVYRSATVIELETKTRRGHVPPTFTIRGTLSDRKLNIAWNVRQPRIGMGIAETIVTTTDKNEIAEVLRKPFVLDTSEASA
jgi:hypothetical protein